MEADKVLTSRSPRRAANIGQPEPRTETRSGLSLFSEKLRLRVAFARRVVDCPDGGGLTHAPLVGWF